MKHISGNSCSLAKSWLAGWAVPHQTSGQPISHFSSQHNTRVVVRAEPVVKVFEPQETQLSVVFLGQQLYLQLSATERQMFNQTGNDFVLQILSVRKSDSEVRKTLLLSEQQKRLVKILDYPFSGSEVMRKVLQPSCAL